MKIGLITDTHMGVRNDNQAIARQQAKANQFFIDEFKKRGVKNILHGGDLFDRRKYINFQTLKLTSETLLEPFNRDFVVDVILGNHDQYYRNTSYVNSLNLLIRGYDNIHVHYDPYELELGKHKVLLLPWICPENYDVSISAIQKSSSLYALGHLELTGFEMHRGSVAQHGMDYRIFSKFDWVGTGHFHHRSIRDNIHYLGAAYQFTWADYRDDRGINILDLETGQVEFIRNPYDNFHVYHYDDKAHLDQIESDLKKSFDGYNDTFVKIKIVNKTNPYLFDQLVQKIQAAAPIKLSIMEESLELYSEDEFEFDQQVEDTPSIIKKYINGLHQDAKNDKLENLMSDLYMEAISLENVD